MKKEKEFFKNNSVIATLTYAFVLLSFLSVFSFFVTNNIIALKIGVTAINMFIGVRIIFFLLNRRKK